MKCVSHRVVNAADVVADRVIEVPYIRRRHRDEFSKAPVAIHPDDPRERADVSIARATKKTAAVHDVTFRSYAITLLHIRDETPHLHDVSSEFVTDDKRRLASRLRPVIPVVNVHIGAAHACAPHANENFVISDSRLRNISQCEARTSRFLHQCFHFSMPLGCCFTSRTHRMSRRASKLTPFVGHWKAARISQNTLRTISDVSIFARRYE